MLPTTKTEYYVSCEGVRIDSVDNSYPDLTAAEEGFKSWTQIPGKNYFIVKEETKTEIHVMHRGKLRVAWYVGKNGKGKLFVSNELLHDDQVLFGPLPQAVAQDKAKQLIEEKK